jgi:hypothetical protein
MDLKRVLLYRVPKSAGLYITLLTKSYIDKYRHVIG